MLGLTNSIPWLGVLRDINSMVKEVEVKLVKIFLLFALILPLSVSAKPLQILSEFDSSKVYYQVTYDCEYVEPGFRSDNKRVPVEGDVVSRSLVVCDKFSRRLDVDASRAADESIRKDKNVQYMIGKVKDFERSGNMPAYEHWSEKVMRAYEKIKLETKMRIYTKFVEGYTEKLPVMHRTVYGSKDYDSFDELKGHVNESCI